MLSNRTPKLLVGVLCLCLTLSAGGRADDVPTEEAESSSSEQERLDILQQAIKNDYDRLEEKLLELAEYTRRTDPDRADLLIRVRRESTSRRISAQMDRVIESLTPSDKGDVLFGDALSRQEELIGDLSALLALLQSEDERDRIDAEIARIQELLKDTNRIIGQQKDVRADTERGGDPKDLQGDQQKVTEEAGQLAEKIDQQDAERQAANSDQSSEGEPKEGDPNEPSEDASDEGKEPGEPSEKEPSESESSEDSEGQSSEQSQSGEGEPQEAAEPSEGEQESSEGQSQKQGQQSSQPGQPQSGQKPQSEQQTPGREQLEQAREQMQRAIEQLQQEKLDEASDEQDAAIAKLEEMKAELEEILRQLREEERKMLLAQLEARFQRMLELQLNINNGTLKLDRQPVEERDNDRHLAESTKLSRDEQSNITEADKALMLLKEDGASVAFPEAVEMMIDNMQAVAGRLQRGQTAETTQLLERLIVESLEEMIFALQKEMEKQEQQQGGEGQQQGQPSDPQLVDQLAELKLIRSLQMQINRLTEQYGSEFEGEQAQELEALNFLRKLSQRQERIQDATYDLSIGKNK